MLASLAASASPFLRVLVFSWLIAFRVLVFSLSGASFVAPSVVVSLCVFQYASSRFTTVCVTIIAVSVAVYRVWLRRFFLFPLHSVAFFRIILPVFLFSTVQRAARALYRHVAGEDSELSLEVLPLRAHEDLSGGVRQAASAMQYVISSFLRFRR